MYQKALKILLAAFGENLPNVATTYNNIGSVYNAQGDYSNALEMFQEALKIDLEIFGENHPNVAASYGNIGYVFYSAKAKGIELPGFKEFTQSSTVICTTLDGNTSASKAGMSGEYYLLEFADWTMDSDVSLFAKIYELQGKPKMIVVMKGDEIAQYHFENNMGTQLGFKKVGEEEKQRIIKAYHEWKAKQ